MSGVESEWMEFESIHLSGIPDKKVCANHIDDKYIKRFVQKNGESGQCDYCKKKVKVVDLDILMPFIMEGILHFYGDAVHFMGYDSSEGGYLGEVFNNWELLDEVELDVDSMELMDDIASSIDDIAWSDTDKYFDTESDILLYRWSYFTKLVKHKSRYLFSTGDTEEYGNALKILNEVGRLVNTFNLIKEIPSGSILYRCRQHQILENVDDLASIVSPPISCAVFPNRFSPSGISMLYAAMDEDIAFSETISGKPIPKNCVTTAKFELKKDINVVDFSKLPFTGSIFGIKDMKKYYWTLFLHELVKDFTKKIEKDGKEHIEYVPTQIVTEYLRFPFNANRKNKIEGIIYPSSKDESKSSIVLFWDNQECLSKLELLEIKRNRRNKLKKI